MAQNEDMLLWDVKLCNKACGQNQSNWNKSLYKKEFTGFTIKKKRKGKQGVYESIHRT